MISTKGKRKVVYEGNTYYWHIKKDENENTVDSYCFGG